MERLTQLFHHETIIYDLIITGLELVGVLGLYFLLHDISAKIFNRAIQHKAFEKIKSPMKTVSRLIGIAFLLSTIALFLLILGVNGYLIYQGIDLQTYQLNFIKEIPVDFFKKLGIALGKFVLVLIGGVYLIRLLDRLLGHAEDKAVTYKQLSHNDKSLKHFFRSLRQIKTIAIWMAAVYLGLIWSPLSEKFPDAVLLSLKVYLIITIGLLIVRAVAAIVDSLDTLSKTYAESNNLLAFYDQLKKLIPLLRKSLEYIVYVAVATLVLKETDFVPGLAEYGPGVIQAIGLVFMARVVTEVIDLFLDMTFLQATQSDEERQKNLTVLPVISSVLSGIVYFITIALILKGIGFDPVPLLAGAGLLSMVVGLGAQSLINDFLSGFFVIFEGQYRVGDFIETSKARGTVEKLTLRITEIRNPDGQLHIIRNGEIKEVVSFSNQYTYAVVNIGIDPSHDLNKVYAALTKLGEGYAAVEENVLEPTVVVGIDDITSPELVVRTTTKVKPGTHLAVARALKHKFTEGLEEAGVGIPFSDRSTAVVVAM